DAHAGGDRAEQPYLGFAECILALVVLEHDRAEYAIAAENGHEHRGQTRVCTRDCEAPVCGRFLGISYNDRLAGAAHDRPGTALARRRRRHGLSHAMLVLVKKVV